MDSLHINLLPEDLREKEEEIRKDIPSKIQEIKMTSPRKLSSRQKEPDKTSWWQEFKRVLTQPLGRTEPTDKGITEKRMPIFEYEKKEMPKPPEKKELIKIKRPSEIKEGKEKDPRLSFWAKFFPSPGASKKERPAFSKEKIAIQQPINALAIKAKKPGLIPEKKEESAKKIPFWAATFTPKENSLKEKPKVKIQPSTLIVKDKKISFFEKFFGAFSKKPEINNKSQKATPAAEKEKSATATKKFKGPAISFIPESEVSIKLKLFRRILFGESIILVFCFLVGLSYLLLLWHQTDLITKSSELEIKIGDFIEQIALNKNKEQEILRDQKRIKAVKALLDQHIYWSNFFALLEKYTIDEVYYKNFTAGSLETITLQAVGKDFKSLARQLVVFSQAKDFVKEVKISSGTQTLTGVNFTVNLTLDSALFKGK